MWKFKVVMVIVCYSFVLGVYSPDRLLPECVSHSNFTQNCVWNDKSIYATTGDTVNRLTEIRIKTEQALELLPGNGQNIEIRDHDDLPFAHGESIVKKEYAKQFHERWIINVSFNFDNTDYGRLIINVTVLNFQPRDEIPLKVVITLGSETVTTTTKKWFVHFSNEQQTTQVPSSTQNVTTNNTKNDKEEENKREKDTGKGEEKSKDCNSEKWLKAIFSLVVFIVIACLILVIQSCRSGNKRCCCHTRYMYSPVSQDDVMLKDVKTIETSCTEPESSNLTVEESV